MSKSAIIGLVIGTIIGNLVVIVYVQHLRIKRDSIEYIKLKDENLKLYYTKNYLSRVHAEQVEQNQRLRIWDTVLRSDNQKLCKRLNRYEGYGN